METVYDSKKCEQVFSRLKECEEKALSSGEALNELKALKYSIILDHSHLFSVYDIDDERQDAILGMLEAINLYSNFSRTERKSLTFDEYAGVYLDSYFSKKYEEEVDIVSLFEIVKVDEEEALLIDTLTEKEVYATVSKSVDNDMLVSSLRYHLPEKEFAIIYGRYLASAPVSQKDLSVLLDTSEELVGLMEKDALYNIREYSSEKGIDCAKMTLDKPHTI